MPIAQTLMDHTAALVIMDTKEMVPTARILMNVLGISASVMKMPTAQTLMDHTTALVTMVTKEMVPTAMSLQLVIIAVTSLRART
jgi:hypothetical protein